jgi:hypothetical protein
MAELPEDLAASDPTETGPAQGSQTQPAQAAPGPVTVPVPVAVPATAPVPDAVTVNSSRIIFIGTAMWTVGFLVLLPFYNELGRHHHRVWLWTCLAGVGVGLFGYVLMRRHRTAGRTT